ncbi:hypothetical protein ACFL58_01380 [Elusimicrobiota bacterium]
MTINKLKQICLLSISITFLLTSLGFTMDIRELRKIAKARDEQARREIKDSLVITDISFFVDNDNNMKSKTIWYTKGIKSRMETEMIFTIPSKMVQKQTYIYNGEKHWMITSDGKTLLNNPQVYKDTQFLGFWINLSKSARLVGSEIINGRDCYVLFFPSGYGEAGSDTYNWLDKNTFTCVKIEDKKEKIVSIMSDFKKINNKWEIPLKTEIFQEGELITVMTVNKCDVNKGLSDSLFEVNNIKDASSNNVSGMDQKAMQEYMRRVQGQQVKKASKNIIANEIEEKKSEQKSKILKSMFKSKIGF